MHPRSQVAQDCSHRQYFFGVIPEKMQQKLFELSRKRIQKGWLKIRKTNNKHIRSNMSTFFQGSSFASVISGPVVFYSLLQLQRLIFRAAGRARDSQGKDMLVVDSRSASGIDTLDEIESVETEVMSKASKGETLASELSESLSKSVSGSSLDLPIYLLFLKFWGLFFLGGVGVTMCTLLIFFSFFCSP